MANCFLAIFLTLVPQEKKLLVVNPLITSQSKSEKVNCLNTFVSSKLPAYQKLKLGPYRMLSFQACKSVLKSFEVKLDLLELVSFSYLSEDKCEGIDQPVPVALQIVFSIQKLINKLKQ